MNPRSLLLKLLATACAALPLGAQPPPAAPEICAPAGLAPLRSIHAHLGGFHFYSGDLRRAVRVEHYCAPPMAGVMQCVVYDTDRPDARLIGVEYIISEERFNGLPAGEKKLWHSHRYEVMSGLLTAPGLSAAAEKDLMKMFVSTYGKTWTLWQVDRGDELPLGLPQLMMGFTADGQVDAGMVADRDRELKLDTAKIKAARADLPAQPVAAGADAWQHEAAFQIPDHRPGPPAARPVR